MQFALCELHFLWYTVLNVIMGAFGLFWYLEGAPKYICYFLFIINGGL